MIYAVLMFVLLLVFALFVITRLAAEHHRPDQEVSSQPESSQDTEV
jgi:hypothetical protein